MANVTIHSKIGALLKERPELAKVLKTFGLDCCGCGGAEHESIFTGATAHGLDPEELVEALNTALK